MEICESGENEKRIKWIVFVVCVLMVTRVFHNGTFLLFCLGNAQFVAPRPKKHADFFSGILELIFLAAGHFLFWMEFHVKYKGKMPKNQKSRFFSAEIIFSLPKEYRKYISRIENIKCKDFQPKIDTLEICWDEKWPKFANYRHLGHF